MRDKERSRQFISALGLHISYDFRFHLGRIEFRRVICFGCCFIEVEYVIRSHARILSKRPSRDPGEKARCLRLRSVFEKSFCIPRGLAYRTRLAALGTATNNLISPRHITAPANRSHLTEFSSSDVLEVFTTITSRVIF